MGCGNVSQQEVCCDTLVTLTIKIYIAHEFVITLVIVSK